MMTNSEEAISNFIGHMFFFVVMFILFCGALFLLVLAITTVWYFIEEGIKYLKGWKAEKRKKK